MVTVNQSKAVSRAVDAVGGGMSSAKDRVDPWLEKWHRIVAERDLGALEGLLAEDIEFGAPPYWAKLEGRALVAHLLG